MPDSYKSLNDQLIEDCKSIGGAGNLPFPSWGSGWGAAQIFRSEAHWDAYIDSQTGFDGNYRTVDEYLQRIGDPGDNSLIMAAVRFLGDAIPEAPLLVKKRGTVGAEGQKGESVVVPDHRLTKLWDRPNDAYEGVTLKKGLAYSLVLSSNAYVLKFFNNAGLWPVELWWEPHWTIRPVWPIDGSQFIAYYEVNRGGVWYPVSTDQVIHIRDGINPYNQRLGLSGNRSVARELFGDQEASSYYANLMGGSGVPGFAIAIDKDKKMDQLKIDAFDRRISEKTRGAKKGQPLILHGAKPYKLGFNPREMDLRETRYMAEDRFCGVQGIPAVVLELGTGHIHSIYNNVKMAMERAWRSYVCPKLTLIEETLNHQLLEDFEGKDSGLYCSHDLSEVQALQEDQDTKAKRNSELYTAGLIMRSEGRSQMQFGPSDPNDIEVDKVFKAVRGESLVKPGEDPLNLIGALSSVSGGPPGSDTQLSSGVNSQEQVTPPKGKLSLVKKPAVKSAQDITWELFPPQFGSLNIPRTAMPQVLSAHRGAMVQFLRGRGITVTKEHVFPSTLRPSQAEYSPEKVSQAREWTGPQRPLLVSKDNYVADGHHQWAAALDKSAETIPIYKINAPIVETLLNLSQFPSSGVKDEKDKHVFWNGNNKKAIPGMRSEFSTILPDCEVNLDKMDPLLALLATDRILTFASEFPKAAELLKQVDMEPNERPQNLAYVQPLDSGGYKLVFNSSLWTDSTVMKEALDKTIFSDGISTTPVDTVESTIDHELAHVLDGWVRLNKNGNAEVSSDNPVWATEDALSLSRYSLAGPREAFAEAFAIRQLFGIDKVPAGEIRQALEDSIAFAG